VCPNCKQAAPIVYRGTLAYCTACGAPRSPFSAKSVNLAGQPSKIGGSIAKFFGWLLLGGGLLLALSLTWFFQLLFPAGMVGYAVGVPVGVISLVVGLLVLFGGKNLERSGLAAERAAKFDALWAMAIARGGVVTALDAGRGLNMAPEGADTLLTEMTKAFPEYVSLEVDDAGSLFYKFAGVAEPEGARFGVKYRVEADGRVRIADELAAGRAAQEAAEWAEWQRQQEGMRSRAR
jgi:hypothetical protein